MCSSHLWKFKKGKLQEHLVCNDRTGLVTIINNKIYALKLSKIS